MVCMLCQTISSLTLVSIGQRRIQLNMSFIFVYFVIKFNTIKVSVNIPHFLSNNLDLLNH